jgi:hypothetical protein
MAHNAIHFHHVTWAEQIERSVARLKREAATLTIVQTEVRVFLHPDRTGGDYAGHRHLSANVQRFLTAGTALADRLE